MAYANLLALATALKSGRDRQDILGYLDHLTEADAQAALDDLTTLLSVNSLLSRSGNVLNLLAENLIFNDTVFDDVRVELSSVKTQGASNVPDRVKIADNGAGSAGIYSWAFDAVTVEQLFFDVQLSHAIKLGASIHPHVHWMPSANGSAGQVVNWGLEYVWVDNFQVMGNTSIIYGNAHVTADASLLAKKNYITDLGNIAATATGGQGVSSILHCRFFRDAAGVGDTDDYAADAWPQSVDFHAEFDRLGSKEEYVQ